MPEEERDVRGEEEEEKKFPVWIVPLVIGPILLVILIAVLAGNQPGTGNGNGEEPFNEAKLVKDAEDLYSKATKFYFDAQKTSTQQEKDALYDKALDETDKALDKLNRIRKYVDDHNIELKPGHVWGWEDTEQKISQLRVDISRDRGLTGDR